jgi:hypothetical protein
MRRPSRRRVPARSVLVQPRDSQVSLAWKEASPPRRSSLLRWTTFESAHRSRVDACFALAEEVSEEARSDARGARRERQLARRALPRQREALFDENRRPTWPLPVDRTATAAGPPGRDEARLRWCRLASGDRTPGGQAQADARLSSEGAVPGRATSWERVRVNRNGDNVAGDRHVVATAHEQPSPCHARRAHTAARHVSCRGRTGGLNGAARSPSLLEAMEGSRRPVGHHEA